MKSFALKVVKLSQNITPFGWYFLRKYKIQQLLFDSIS